MAVADEKTESPPAAVPHFTVAERAARGRAARDECPRSSHAAFDLAPGRDPVAILEAQAPSRLQDLVPIRYGRMLVSPFTFYRGAAAVMAYDLAPTPRAGLQAQLCGDAHLANVGGFASPERKLVVDLNDFDETLPGPFEWDVKRLAASVEIAGRDRGFADAQREEAVLAAVRSYRTQMAQLAEMGNLDVWYARADASSLDTELRGLHDRREARRIERMASAASANTSERAVAKLTRTIDGTPRIVSEPPLIVPIDELEDGRTDLGPKLRSIYRSYCRSLPDDRRRLVDEYRYGDAARKVVGVGSVGTRCWIVLLFGRGRRDPLFLQLKEAQPSVLEDHLGRSAYRNHAQRIVEGQRLSQAASDIFLGWLRTDDLEGRQRDFYLRQLRDWKVSADLDRILPEGLTVYARWCGSTLARAHARSGDRVAIAGYLGRSDTFDRALAEFAGSYADLNQDDYEAFVAAQ
jgi:uncharacterized protein (DUF2252 family)